MSETSLHKTWSVLVMDMFHSHDSDEHYLVKGFSSWEDARDYARARTWSSVQEMREPEMTAEALRSRWHMFGESVSVMGEPHYSGYDEIDFFVANEPSSAQMVWTDPADRPGLPKYADNAKVHGC